MLLVHFTLRVSVHTVINNQWTFENDSHQDHNKSRWVVAVGLCTTMRTSTSVSGHFVFFLLFAASILYYLAEFNFGMVGLVTLQD